MNHDIAAEAQNMHLKARVLEKLARREPVVRDLIAERDALKARVDELEAKGKAKAKAAK